jgi:tRNA-Thr(GGU) m(6)t(6)A37 methyltransferase TsaA
MELKIIARIRTDFKEKFGIPRQSGLAPTIGKIVFEKEYRRKEALMGLSGYSHIWLLWEFSEAVRERWSPTVRPPRLGGNKRMGVFATRSPYRPNPIGLSSVELLKIESTENDGDVLIVRGADIVDGTPIYDIKPYLKFTDSHEDAKGGFADEVLEYKLNVEIPEDFISGISAAERAGLIAVLENDPRPSYINDANREYGMSFSDFEIRFKVSNSVLTVTSIEKNKEND